MGNDFVSYSFVLLLVVTLAVTSNGADVLRLRSMDSDGMHTGGEKNVRKPSSGGGWAVSMDDPNDPAVQVFALIKDLVVGKTMPIYFPYIKDQTLFQFFPRETTQHIPFSSEAIPELLRFFSFASDSKQALAMRQTLEVCEKEPKQGEVRGCATNIESLEDFARGILGSDSRVEILRSSMLSDPSTPLVQNYTILDFTAISIGDIVPCHSEPYPYPVYYCHFQLGAESRVFKVHLRGENGEMVDSVFLCHMDTSTWRPGHVAFRLLGVKAGESEVCHFMAAHDLAMFPVPNALYVVDLVKFRETAAGDNLRVFYESLSKDPNSLANLDQDLPNYAQHTVPIFSLPQEWLWCESWCGNATKSKAKTIDLCNNPMIKEPKLQGARRIVSEWTGLDFEARKFTAKILGDEITILNPQHHSKPPLLTDRRRIRNLRPSCETFGLEKSWGFGCSILPRKISDHFFF